MKPIITVLCILFTVCSYAQVPSGINYQALALDVDGEVLANKQIAVRISFLDEFQSDNVLYQEIHQVSTDAGGLFTLILGQGTVSMGSFDDLTWSSNQKSLSVEIDENGGENFIEVGELQLLTVPYAFHARTVENNDDADADPENELINELKLTENLLEITDAGGTKSVDLSVLVKDGDFDETNEIQEILTDGTSGNISISDGSELLINVDDADADETNELVTELKLIDDFLELTEGGNTKSVDLSELKNDLDANPANELLEEVLLEGSVLRLTDAGGTRNVDLTSLIEDADADATNEIQELSTDGTSGNISISNGSTLTLMVDDADADATNEIQDIYLDGSILKITGGSGSIDIGDGVNTDNQNLSFDGTNISITNGNSVDLSELIEDDDSSITNEIQDLSTDGTAGNIRISEGSTINLNVDDHDADPENEIQDLFLDGSVLKITGGSAEIEIGSGTNTDNQNLSFDGESLSISGGNSVDFGSSFWAKTGNEISDAEEEYLGTNNEADLRIVTNGSERMIIKSDGKFGIGVSVPEHAIHIETETTPTSSLDEPIFQQGNSAVF